MLQLVKDNHQLAKLVLFTPFLYPQEDQFQ